MHRGDTFNSPLSLDEIEQIAVAWREAFGYKNAWVPDIIHILENMMPEILDSFSLRVFDEKESEMDVEGYTTSFPPEIHLRLDVYEGAVSGEGRHRFTAAHEFGHLVLHGGYSQARHTGHITKLEISRISVEKQADAFAAAFLMPRHIVRNFISPEELSDGCQVSYSAAEFRMKSLRLWPKVRKSPQVVIDFLKAHGRL